MKTEIWKWIRVQSKEEMVSYKGTYKISNYGRIKRTRNVEYNSRFGKVHKTIIRFKGLVSPTLNNGYLRASLVTEKGSKEFRIHILVLHTFVGSCPKGMECRHLNDIRSDNRWPENLCWGTHKQNGLDSYQNNKHPDKKGENSPTARLKGKDVLKIRSLYKTGFYLQKELGEKFGVSSKHISALVLEKNWKHL